MRDVSEPDWTPSSTLREGDLEQPVEPLEMLSMNEAAADTEHKMALPADKVGIQPPMDLVADTGLLTGIKLYLVFGSLMLCVLLIALDQSIVSTAIPVIVSDFHTFSQVSWIVTGDFLTQCGLILVVGQLLTIIKAKWLLLGAVFFFELGSLICAVAHGMDVLIFGRAVQGIGASGMFVSVLAVIATITRVDQRAAFLVSFGFVFVVASLIGPILGGAFTQYVTWRWCFWINLPVGGLAAAAVTVLLPPRDTAVDIAVVVVSDKGWRGLKKMDWVGTAIIFASVTCLLLALSWAGNEYAWNSWRIILLFTLGGSLVVVFGLWEVWMNKSALIPISILKNRTEIAAVGAIFFFMIALLGGIYQLPLFYQATRGHTREKSGIDVIPFMLSVCFGMFLSGGLVTKFGRYYPFFAIGPVIAAIGFGLLYTIDQNTSNPRLIGYQILAGVGEGLVFQNVLLAVQAEYSDRPHLIPQASGLVSFFQLTGAALGVGIINAVQSVYLNKELVILAPEVPFEVVRQSVAAIYTLPKEQQAPVIEAYVIAITKSFVPIFVALAVGMIFALFARDHNLLTKQARPGPAA